MAFLSTCHFRATKNLYSKSLLHMKATRTSGHLQHLDVQLFNRQIKKRTAAFWVTHYHHIPLYLISMPNCTANGYFTLGSNASFIMHNIYCFSVSFVFLFACLHFIVLLEPAVNLCLCSLRCFFFLLFRCYFLRFCALWLVVIAGISLFVLAIFEPQSGWLYIIIMCVVWFLLVTSLSGCGSDRRHLCRH